MKNPQAIIFRVVHYRWDCPACGHANQPTADLTGEVVTCAACGMQAVAVEESS